MQIQRIQESIDERPSFLEPNFTSIFTATHDLKDIIESDIEKDHNYDESYSLFDITAALHDNTTQLIPYNTTHY